MSRPFDDRPEIEIWRMVRCLHDPSDIIEARFLPSARSFWCEAHELAAYADALNAENAAGENLYVGANPRTARGVRGDGNVALARCVFADFDLTTFAIAETKRHGAKLPLPTLSIDSGHGVHFYWRLLEALNPDAWRASQKGLAAMLGSDTTVCNPERIMRLPGFLNLKREPVPCRVINCDPRNVYALDALAIPPVVESPVPAFTVRIERADADAGDPVARCRAYLMKCPPAISGNKGHRTTWHAANTCNRFGLSKDDAYAVLSWYSAAKCDPPWTDKEIRHKVDDAYTRNAGQHGAKLREERRPRSPGFTVRQNREAA